jgi:hypothetical protein
MVRTPIVGLFLYEFIACWTPGWPCTVTNIETDEYEKFYLSVIERARFNTNLPPRARCGCCTYVRAITVFRLLSCADQI